MIPLSLATWVERRVRADPTSSQKTSTRRSPRVEDTSTDSICVHLPKLLDAQLTPRSLLSCGPLEVLSPPSFFLQCQDSK